MLSTALGILRIAVGLILAGHGAQKLFGWFGGHGLSGTRDYLRSLGVPASNIMAALAAVLEFLAGLALALGLATPVAAAAIVSVLVAAMAVAHWPRFWATRGGIEYPLVLAAIAALFGLTGPGDYALDTVLGIAGSLPAVQAFVASLGVGIVVVAAVLVVRRTEAAPAEEQGHRQDGGITRAA